MAYLSYLLEQDRDFAGKAKELDANEQVAIKRQRYQQTLDSLDGGYDGWLVVTASEQLLGAFICRDGN